MARKKSGLKPETLDDGGLFGDIELVYEEAKENACLLYTSDAADEL